MLCGWEYHLNMIENGHIWQLIPETREDTATRFSIVTSIRLSLLGGAVHLYRKMFNNTRKVTNIVKNKKTLSLKTGTVCN